MAGDSIWNGADDNGNVSVGILAIGRAFAGCPRRRRPTSPERRGVDQSEEEMRPSAPQGVGVLCHAKSLEAADPTAGGAVVIALSLFFPGPGVESLAERLGMAIGSGIVWGLRFGIAGTAIGAAFSSIIRLAYRGRRLADINPVRFALLGAVVGGGLFLQAMNVLSGDGPIAWGLVLDDAPWATVFGAAVAAGSILLARRADALTQEPRPDQLECGDDWDGQPAAGQRKPSIPRSRRPWSRHQGRGGSSG